jgi:hypothetical protein
LQRRVKIQESDHLRAARAEIRSLSIVEEVWFQEKQLIAFHGIPDLKSVLERNL